MVDWYFIKWVWLGFSLQVFTNFAGTFPLAINGSCISRSMHDSFCFPLFKRRWVLRQYPSLVVAVARSVAFLYNGYCISLCFFFWSRAILFNYERAQCLESHLKFSICGKLCYLVHKKSRHSTYIIIAWSVYTTKQQIKLY